MRLSFIIVFFLFNLNLITIALSDDDLEEAKALDEISIIKNDESLVSHSLRAYFLSEYAYTIKRFDKENNHYVARTNDNTFHEILNFEASLSYKYNLTKEFQFFFDGIIRYYDPSSDLRKENLRQTNSANKGDFEEFLNQAGLRYQINSKINLAIGKERNRITPGLIISPGDIIYSKDSLPGLREERNGVYLFRTSYQTSDETYDFIYLPAKEVDKHGMIKKIKNQFNFILRGFKRVNKYSDLMLSVGSVEKNKLIGLGLQSVVHSTVKLYSEFRFTHFDETNRQYIKPKGQQTQYLFGVDYQGIQDLSTRLEYYYTSIALLDHFSSSSVNESTNSSSEVYNLNPFLKHSYLILSLTKREIFNLFDETLNAIFGLDDDAILLINRLSVPLNSKLSLGNSIFFNANHSKNNQYALLFFEGRTTLDLRYSF